MKFIAIEGNIGAGKTTLAKMLSEHFAGYLFLEEFEENPFLEAFYKNSQENAFKVELSFLVDRYKQMQREILQPNLFHEYIISDYIIHKCAIFAKNNLSQDEFELFMNLYKLVEKTAPKPSVIIHVHRPIEVLLNQIKQRGRTFEKDVEATYLQEIQNRYTEVYRTLDTPILIVDADDKDYKSSKNILQPIIERVECGLDFKKEYLKL